MERPSLRIHTSSMSIASSTRSPRSAGSSSHSGSSSSGSGVSLHAMQLQPAAAAAAASTKRRRSPSQPRAILDDDEFAALSPCCDRDASFEEMSGEELAAAFPSAEPAAAQRTYMQTAEAPLDSAVAGLRIAASPAVITSEFDSFESSKRTEHAPAPKRAGPVGSRSASSTSSAAVCGGFDEEDCHHQHKKAVTLSRASSSSISSSCSSSAIMQPTRPSQAMADFSEEQDCFSICEEIPMPVKVAATFQPAIQPPPQVAAPVVPVKSSVPLERGLDGRQITSMQRLQERQNIVRVLSCNLEQLCPVGAPLPADPMFLSLFHTSAMPGISIREYMERLSIYTAVTEEAMIQACMHIVRLAHNGRVEAEQRDHARMLNRTNPAFPPCAVVNGTPHPRINSFSAEPFQVSCFNIHRLLLTALLTTAKYVDDAFHNNRLFSSLGGITLKELNQLEMEFLHLLDYKMTVEVAEFRFMYDQVFNNPARHAEGCCSTLHVMGPQIVFEDQPGCDDPFIPCDAQGFAIQGEQEIVTFVPQPPAQRAAIAAATAAQQQFLQVPASVSVSLNNASASVFEADLDDGMRSTSSSPSASPAQSVRSQATAASITRRMEVMSAEPPMIKEHLVVSHGNKGQYVNRSPVSSSYSSLGIRNAASHVALQSVTRQGYSPSLSTRDYGRKTLAYKENTAHRPTTTAAAANKQHAAYLQRHGAANLFTPSPMSMMGEGGHHDAFDTNMV